MLKRSRRHGKKILRNYVKKISKNQITMMVWLVIQNETSWSAVRWALRSTAVYKTSGCNEILAETVISLKNDAIKVLHLLCQQIWKPSSGHRTGKGQSSSQFPRRIVPKNVLTIGQLHSSPMPVCSFLKSCMLGFSTM